MPKALGLVALLALVGASGVGPGPAAAVAGPPVPNCNQVNLHPGSLQTGPVSVSCSDTLWLTPANLALPLTVLGVVAGTLPTGLSLVAGPNANPVTLRGTPTATGVFTFTVEVGGTYLLGTICKVVSTCTVPIL